MLSKLWLRTIYTDNVCFCRISCCDHRKNHTNNVCFWRISCCVAADSTASDSVESVASADSVAAAAAADTRRMNFCSDEESTSPECSAVAALLNKPTVNQI